MYCMFTSRVARKFFETHTLAVGMSVYKSKLSCDTIIYVSRLLAVNADAAAVLWLADDVTVELLAWWHFTATRDMECISKRTASHCAKKRTFHSQQYLWKVIYTVLQWLE